MSCEDVETLNVAGGTSRAEVDRKTSGDSNDRADMDDMNSAGSFKDKGSKVNGSNFAKPCWFFMNNNYCRYGRFCRFSHARSSPPGRKNLPQENRQVRLEGNDFRSKNPNEAVNRRRASNRARNVENNDSTRSEKANKSFAMAASSSEGRRTPDESNSEVVDEPKVHARQRNLYFYPSSSSNKSRKGRSEPGKPCRYFVKGFCRQGERCKFLHQQSGKNEMTKESNDESTKKSADFKDAKELQNDELGEAVNERSDDAQNKGIETAQDEGLVDAQNKGSVRVQNKVLEEAPNKSMVEGCNEGLEKTQKESLAAEKNESWAEAENESWAEARNESWAEAKNESWAEAQHEGLAEAENEGLAEVQDDEGVAEVQDDEGLAEVQDEGLVEAQSEGSAEASNESQAPTESTANVQNYSCNDLPIANRVLDKESETEENIQRLRDTEIQQLKIRFRDFKVVESSPDSDVFHITFYPTDPAWPFSVSSIPLEISLGKNYPREACKIKVRDGGMPFLLVEYFNTIIDDWIRLKHAACVALHAIQLLFRPFLRWLDQHLEELFLEGLRRIKLDLLAERAKMQNTPPENQPEAIPAAPVSHSEEDDAQDVANALDENSSKVSSHEGLEQAGEPGVESEDDQPSHNDVQGKEAEAFPQNEDWCSSADFEKEELCALLQGATSSLSRDDEQAFSASGSSVKLTIPKSGTEIKLQSLEMKEDAAAMTCTKIAITLQCGRCKTRHEIITQPRRNNTLSCTKCHQSMQVVFQPAILHQFSAVMGYLHLVDCKAVDIPLMECNFKVDCLNCAKQISLSGIHYGHQRVTWCLFCNKKMCIYVQSVKFQQLQPGLGIGLAGQKVTIPTKKEKKSVKDPAIQEGKPLPDCGTCKHYKKSYRWMRFPCCGKTYPCDICHDEKETDHDMKYANRMICGFCAKEQPYSAERPCVSCSSNMTKKAGAHWEGGKGCRDRTTMSKEDRQKYSGTGKTISRKAQAQKPNKK